MSWGKRILIGATAAYLAFSVIPTGIKSKNFAYLIDHLGNQNGHAEESEFDAEMRQFPPQPATLDPLTAYICYDPDNALPDDTRILFSYHTLEGLERMIEQSGRKDPLGVVAVTYLPGMRYDSIIAYKKILKISYYDYDGKQLRPETRQDKAKRQLQTYLN
ncbi:MAG: hypothetical protein ABIJ21_09130 [Nanoarchaeota archaeon]